MNWSRRGAGTKAYLMGVACGLGNFVAVGTDGTILMSQDDGQSWMLQNSGLRGVTFGDGRFVAVPDSGEVLTSTNGQNWMLQGERGFGDES